MPWLAMQRLDRPCEALVGIAWPCAALLCPDQPIIIARLCQALRSHAKLCWAVLRPAMHFDAHARAHISCVTLLGQFVGHFCGSLRGARLWAPGRSWVTSWVTFVGHMPCLSGSLPLERRQRPSPQVATPLISFQSPDTRPRDRTRALQEGRRWLRYGPGCPQDSQRGHQEDTQVAIKL